MTDELDVALDVAAACDVDFVIDLDEAQVGAFAEALGPDFDVDAEALEDAVRRRGSWNVFHLPLVVKIDLFVVGTTEYDRSEMARRRRFIVRDDGAALYVKAPEDTILRKLLCYRQGGEVSERQWRDVLGVLRVSGAELDAGYLDVWAGKLDLVELLRRARASATSQ